MNSKPTETLQLLEEAADCLTGMLATIEMGVLWKDELPRELKSDWTRFQDAIRQLISIDYVVPERWTVLAFARLPVIDAELEALGPRGDDLDSIAEYEQFRHGIKIDYKSWSAVCDEIRIEIEKTKARIVAQSHLADPDSQANSLANDAHADIPECEETTRRTVRKKKSRKRGRPSDTDHRKDKEIYEQWTDGSYVSYANLAETLEMRKQDVKRAIDRHRKRVERAK